MRYVYSRLGIGRRGSAGADRCVSSFRRSCRKGGAGLNVKGGETVSFSIDTTTIFQMASDVVSWLMPVVGISAGFALGFAILKKIVAAFRSGI